MITRFTAALLSICFTGVVDAAPEKRVVDGVTYHILQTSAEAVRMVWKNDEGMPLRTFPEVARYFAAAKVAVDTLMNGGIFEPGGVPSGLFIQNGKQLRPVNQSNGEGNFYLKPNGIFLITEKGGAVIDTAEFALQRGEIQQALQSGPLLLRRGRVHPAFNTNSSSRLHRNGVGITKDGMVIFAMSDYHSPKFPNLYEFARLFHLLGCEDALFLDGDLSQMRSGADITKPSNHFGSIIAVIQADSEPSANPQLESAGGWERNEGNSTAPRQEGR